MGGQAPHGASQGLLGQVTDPVLGESEPPPVVSESALLPGIASHRRRCTWRQVPHAFLTPSGLPHSALRHIHEVDTVLPLWSLRGLPCHLAPVWSSSAKPGSPGPSWRNKVLSRLSASCPTWPSPRLPFQHLRPSPAPALASPAKAGCRKQLGHTQGPGCSGQALWGHLHWGW